VLNDSAVELRFCVHPISNCLLYHVVFGLGLRCFSHVYGLLLCMMSQLCCVIVYVFPIKVNSFDYFIVSLS